MIVPWPQRVLPPLGPFLMADGERNE